MKEASLNALKTGIIIDTQKESSGQNAKDIYDQKIDVTRSKNREGADESNAGRDVLNKVVDGGERRK